MTDNEDRLLLIYSCWHEHIENFPSDDDGPDEENVARLLDDINEALELLGLEAVTLEEFPHVLRKAVDAGRAQDEATIKPPN